GLRVCDDLVDTCDDRPRRFERSTECKILEVLNKLIARLFNKTRQLVSRSPSRWNDRIGVARNHREGTTRKIAQATREITVRAIDQPFITKTPVLSEHHLAQTEVTNRIDRKVSM